MPLSKPDVAVNVTPFGNAPLSLNVGAGAPVAVTVNVPGMPTVKVALLGLVMFGGVPTTNVACAVAVPLPLQLDCGAAFTLKV